MTKNYIALLTVLISIGLGAVPCLAAVIHVPGDQPTIQAGIDAATHGDTVLVAPGVYAGIGNRDIYIHSKELRLLSEEGAATCIIDCDSSYGSRGIRISSASQRHVVVEGFTIMNAANEAGGLGCAQGSLELRDCIMINNPGGAISCYESTAWITNCTISNCGSNESPGAVYVNYSDVFFDQCVIQGNTSTTGYQKQGGGIYCNESGLVMTNCIVADNQLGPIGIGGGLSICSSTASISGTVFFGNKVGTNGWGGGMSITGDSTVSMENCIMCGNIGTLGSTISLFGDASLSLMNCVIANNQFDTKGTIDIDLSSISITNSILWSNSPTTFHMGDAVVIDVSYSDIQGGYTGIGNIDLDPLFLGGEPFDYHLSPFSPCIDTGTSEGAPSTDLDGHHRPVAENVDMGAYEFHLPSRTHAYIGMPSHEFAPGDQASCAVRIWNSSDDLPEDTRLFVVLDVLGDFYFAPRFSSFDWYTEGFPNGWSEKIVIDEFIWPSGAGTLSGLNWITVLTNSEMTEFLSEFGSFNFGWTE